jgi:type IV pilus assembly protein PilE
LEAKAVINGPAPSRDCSVDSGFTLVEILLTIGLIALLFSLSLPQYSNYLQRSHRVEAIRMLMEVAACQERLRAGSGSYDTTRCLGVPEGEHYRLSIEPEARVSSDVYELTAEPVNLAGNETCGSLSLNQAGTRAISGPDENLEKCWSGR